MRIEGLLTYLTGLGPGEAADRLEASIEGEGLTLFARIDHAAGAEAVGLELRPTILLVFGNAKAGTLLMQAAPSIGIDLPLKALVWKDDSARTCVSFNDPGWLARRHGLGADVEATVLAMSAMVARVARSVAPDG
jgi:uncharacterized protein (DUF302 family)